MVQHDTPTSTWAQETQEAQPHATPPHQGMCLAGRFRLGERLGVGATGEVWSALDTQVGRTVALKIVRSELRDRTSRERLRREARAATTGHSNLIAIHDLHEADGHMFLSMELVQGQTLKALTDAHGALPVENVVAIGRDIASALAHLHHQGLVHRDVKPGNIMLTPSGAAKLCDLGLSRPLASGGTMTETQMVVGTPAYMAPEQGRAGELSTAVDIYALGLTLFKALTDQVPLHTDSAVDTLIARQQHRPEPVRRHRQDCPRWLDRLLGSMLEPRPADRPTAAGVLRGLSQHRWRRINRRSVLRAASIAVCLLAILGASLWWHAVAARSSVLEPVDYRVIDHANGTTLEILDQSGQPLGVLRTDSTWYSEEWQKRRGVHLITFPDLDGDGSREIVFADPAASADATITVWRFSNSGELQQVRSLATPASYTYDGITFDDFRARHVDSADLTGDGRDEIVVSLLSTPLYTTLIRVLDGQGHTVTDLWHPGYLARTYIADGDDDGTLDLYAAGTCNFIADDVGNESTPVILRLSKDWRSPPATVDLFGAGRSLASTVSEGIDLVYGNVGKVRLSGYAVAWEMLYFTSNTQPRAPVRLHTVASQTQQRAADGAEAFRGYLRGFTFDGSLRLVSASWQPDHLVRLGHNPSKPELQQFLEVRYWNGQSWQREHGAIPTRIATASLSREAAKSQRIN